MTRSLYILDLETVFASTICTRPVKSILITFSVKLVPIEFATRGYRRQLCLDFSDVVVQLMTERHSQTAGIQWKRMDVRNMHGIADKCIDIAFDKGTLDVMVHGSPWTPPDAVKEDASAYMKEVVSRKLEVYHSDALPSCIEFSRTMGCFSTSLSDSLIS